MKFDRIVDFAARTKQYSVYGVSLAYPFFSLVTFLGVIKMAFGIPPEIAAIIAFIGVYVVGVTSFKIGLYSKDMNITWKNTQWQSIFMNVQIGSKNLWNVSKSILVLAND